LRFPKPAKRSPKPRKRVKRSIRPHAVRQTKRAAQERKLDRLWSLAVRGRDGHRCRMHCGRNGTDAHHIHGRSHKGTRWVLDNGITLCRQDHQEAHRRPKHFKEFVQWYLVSEEAWLALAEKLSQRPDLDQAARELAG
jgi:hypothetical protein